MAEETRDLPQMVEKAMGSIWSTHDNRRTTCFRNTR